MDFKENQTLQKLRGGYYTPSDIASYIAKWVSKKNPSKILEPSCGDGAFIEAIAQYSDGVSLSAFEIDPLEASKALEKSKLGSFKKTEVKDTDFLEWSLSKVLSRQELFDAVIGNPPFIRYQFLPENFQEHSERIFSALGCRFTKHTNAWVPFILASIALLKPGGRLGMVVPSEIIHVMHAQSLRTFLGSECKRLVIIDPQELWFEDTLQGAVILMAEKAHEGEYREGLAIRSVVGRQFLNEDPEMMFQSGAAINGKTISGKWTNALLGKSAMGLLDALDDDPNFCRFNDAAEVAVGIVTGANKFFLVSDETVEKYELSNWAHPMFGRSDHCPGILYNEKQHLHNAQRGKPTNFIWFEDDAVETHPVAKKYIELGESDDLHKRYKCRIRENWYTVPSVYSAPIGMLKRAHDTPRLISNEIKAYTTDTAYRVKPRSISSDKLVYGFHNPLTALSAELEGRHYGGGVLELVPSEIRKLRLPDMAKLNPDLVKLDSDIRVLDTEVMLEMQGDKVLEPLGVSVSDRLELLTAWDRLRKRRQRVDAP